MTLSLSYWTLEHARALDAQDPLRHLRAEFHIPSRADVAGAGLLGGNGNGGKDGEAGGADEGSANDPARDHSHDAPSIYLCGNSLGLQPHRTTTLVTHHLTTWATRGVLGHMSKSSTDASPLPPWLHADRVIAKAIAPIVGAHAEEVAVMQTLTANLHLLMCAFYKPRAEGRHKILLESRAFPSDHFAAESQILHHGFDPATSLITIEPDATSTAEDGLPPSPLISTEHILDMIQTHASTTSILLLPAIQYYTGQLFDIRTITAAAHAAGIFVIWDLAHAIGNVELQLHDDEVDAAVWCSYKYLNGGPGSVGGLYVHERYAGMAEDTSAQMDEPTSNTAASSKDDKPSSTPKTVKDWPNRLSGWWGNALATRFNMATEKGFTPVPGAAGFQLSNPSILAITALTASLDVFEQAGGMAPLRKKSVALTGYLERLLLRLIGGDDTTAVDAADNQSSKADHHASTTSTQPRTLPIKIITSSFPFRGAQLSLRLLPPLHTSLPFIMPELLRRGVVVDERSPDVIRVAPAPLYNSFEDVWWFVRALEEAVRMVMDGEVDKQEGTRMMEVTT